MASLTFSAAVGADGLNWEVRGQEFYGALHTFNERALQQLYKRQRIPTSVFILHTQQCTNLHPLV